VLAAPLITALGTQEQRAEFLPRIARGELTATLAVPGSALSLALGLTGDNRGEWAGGGRAGGVQARRATDGWRLYGQAEQVLDGHGTGLLLVAAHVGGYARSRTLLFAVRAEGGGPGADGAEGLVRTRRTVLDETRPQARVELRDTPAELLGEAGDGARVARALARVGSGAATTLAAEAVGAADRALHNTVEYVKGREQFGRPIGSFQAVQHRLADLYVRVQAARSAAYYAAWAAGADDSRLAVVGPLALAQALEALRTVAGEAVQLHGGIGFTWEHDAHLYVKRAASDELLFGPVHRLRACAADGAGLFDGSRGHASRHDSGDVREGGAPDGPVREAVAL
jgi:alkylation response protein AidB-like acyl-CoA dehydrogenase